MEQAARVNKRGGEESSRMKLMSFENSVLCLDIKPLGPVFGLPGTMMRQQSIQRAVTTNHRRNSCQVIIKNTFSLKETGEESVKRSGTLSRSRSLMSTNHIPLLAPRRADRQRMEQKMSEVWTKDRLPYPGMTGHRGGHLIRTSATSVMRRISIASTTTTASSVKRRTTTHGSEDPKKPESTRFISALLNQTDGASSPTIENLQIYPEDFWSTLEYQDPNPYAEGIASIAKKGIPTEMSPQSDRNVGNHSLRRQKSEASTIIATPNQKGLEHGKARLSKPRILLKAFSTENIRGWFH